MAVTETREVVVAEAHSCGPAIHVSVDGPLSVDQSIELRAELEVAEQEATQWVDGTRAAIDEALAEIGRHFGIKIGGE